MKKQAWKPALMMDLNPESPISESYHSLRANLDFQTAGRENGVLSVTSAERGEGKSTTSMNLALACARTGKHVLLVDADFRNPTIHALLGLSRRDGLSDCLGGRTGLSEAVKPSLYPNLDVLTSGTLAANPTELMSAESLKELFDVLKSRYDRIIADAPPLLGAVDAQIIAAASDGVILVIRHGKTSKALTQKAIKTLEHVRTPLLGAVLNRSNRKSAYAY